VVVFASALLVCGSEWVQGTTLPVCYHSSRSAAPASRPKETTD